MAMGDTIINLWHGDKSTAVGANQTNSPQCAFKGPQHDSDMINLKWRGGLKTLLVLGFHCKPCMRYGFNLPRLTLAKQTAFYHGCLFEIPFDVKMSGEKRKYQLGPCCGGWGMEVLGTGSNRSRKQDD